MTRFIAAAASIVLTCSALAQPIQARRLGTTTYTNPVLVTAAAGEQTRVFVVERIGRVRVVNGGTGAVNATPFLTIPNVDTQSEAGLLGLAFHPEYQANGYLYVYYTRQALGGQTPAGRVIARYRVSPNNPDVADPTSATIIYYQPVPISIHTGGWTAFGPDGRLYVAWGDAAQPENAQSIDNPFGKLLRLDVNGTDGQPGTGDDDQLPADPDRNYGVPPDNPFVGVPGDDLVWAMGLRNPWRNCFDPSSGALIVTDVGDTTWEELNVAPAPPAGGGRNYGWPCMEGHFCRGSTTDTSCACNSPTFTAPVYTYRTGPGSCAIQGGYVYRGCRMPWLAGRLFFGDFCGSFVKSGRIEGNGLVDVIDHTEEVWAGVPHSLIVGFGEDAAGELYVIDVAGAVFTLGPTTPQDCNTNGVVDGCDIASGLSTDYDRDHTPDECQTPRPCRPCDADFNQDGDTGTDQDIEAFFRALAGHGPLGSDFNADGDSGTDADIESFFRVLAGNPC
jgi:glucose/arabinose dehydrogenase